MTEIVNNRLLTTNEKQNSFSYDQSKSGESNVTQDQTNAGRRNTI